MTFGYAHRGKDLFITNFDAKGGPQAPRNFIAHVHDDEACALLVRQANAFQAAENLSPAVSFLYAAQASIPKTMGDRDRMALMNELISTAVRSKMQFKHDDAKALERIHERGQYGVVRTIDERLYALGCSVGGTYTRMYEKATGLTPWMAPEVISGTIRNQRNVKLTNNRVGVGMIVLFRDKVDPGLPQENGSGVWWCTSLGNDQITLCQYRIGQYRFERSGQPESRQKFDRESWAACFNLATDSSTAQPLQPRERARG